MNNKEIYLKLLKEKWYLFILEMVWLAMFAAMILDEDKVVRNAADNRSVLLMGIFWCAIFILINSRIYKGFQEYETIN